MNKNDFLSLDREAQNAQLLRMASNAIAVLSDFPKAKGIAASSYALLARYMGGETLPASEIGQYLNHEDMDQDLGMQIYNVDGRKSAISAIDIVCYATGAISKYAFEEQGIPKEMSDPVQESTPDVVVQAVVEYQALIDQGLVPPLA